MTANAFIRAPGPRAPATPSEGSGVFEPTTILQTFVETQFSVLLEACRRLHDDLPGLTEAVQDHVVLSVAGSSKNALGWFAHDAWRPEERYAHETFVNARLFDADNDDAAADAAEQLLVTLLHEALHLHGFVNGICTTSRQGRYHGRAFAELALQAKLAIVKAPPYGWTTSCLQDAGRVVFGDLVAELERSLVITRVPKLVPALEAVLEDGDEADATDSPPSSGAQPDSRYVFPHCACPGAKKDTFVTIRVSRSVWLGQIGCTICNSFFTLTGEQVSDTTVSTDLVVQFGERVSDTAPSKELVVFQTTETGWSSRASPQRAGPAAATAGPSSRLNNSLINCSDQGSARAEHGGRGLPACHGSIPTGEEPRS
jgi:hypothetical protein